MLNEFEARTIEAFVGKTPIKIEIVKESEWNDAEEVQWTFSDGSRYVMRHEQDCCEVADAVDIDGDIQKLIGFPLLIAEVVSGITARQKDEYDESWTWTFYKFANIKGYITMAWYVSSNGYYSEDIAISEVK